MRHFRLSIGFLFGSILLFATLLMAQDNLREQMFGETDAIMQKAKDKNAELFAPRSFGKAMEYYNNADDAFKKGKKIEDISDNLKNASAYFAKALNACKAAEDVFNAVMIARADAKSADAPKYTSDLWAKSEDQFTKAIRELEDGDTQGAKQHAIEVETSYRTAELEAIKANYLSPTWALLKQADDLGVQDYAPKTLEKAKLLTHQVEEVLKQNRRDAEQARTLAGEAKYEATHALYLYKVITKMKSDDKQMEEQLLSDEAQFQRVATALGIQTGFEEGFEKPASDMVAEIKARDAASARDADSLRVTTEELHASQIEADNLNQQIASMQNRLGTLTDNEKDLQLKLATQHEQEMKIRSLSNMFTSDEGNVLRDGDNIIIRLYGLTFQSGKSEIEPRYYPLLTRVQEAIRKFDNCTVKIEGHTDSKGNERINQTLSEGRAKAVAEYLMANMGVEKPINYEGFGDTKPVTTNSTEEGRAKNRRIDVVITPGWATPGK
jgi:OOP family OmpA-OmpF porin